MELILVSGIGVFTLLLVEFADRVRGARAPSGREPGRAISHGKERTHAAGRTDRLTIAATITLPAR